MGKVFRRQPALGSERVVWKREGSSKLHEWSFMMTFGCDSCWRKGRMVELMIFQDEVSRFKNILGIAIAIGTNPASGFYFENRIARSWLSPCVGLKWVTTHPPRSDHFHRRRVVCSGAAYVVITISLPLNYNNFNLVQRLQFSTNRYHSARSKFATTLSTLDPPVK